MSKYTKEEIINNAKRLITQHSRTMEVLAAGITKWIPQCDCHCTEILFGDYVETPQCRDCSTNYKKLSENNG